MLHKYELTFQFSIDHAAVTTDLQIGTFRPYITSDPNMSQSIFDAITTKKYWTARIFRHSLPEIWIIGHSILHVDYLVQHKNNGGICGAVTVRFNVILENESILHIDPSANHSNVTASYYVSLADKYWLFENFL